MGPAEREDEGSRSIRLNLNHRKPSPSRAKGAGPSLSPRERCSAVHHLSTRGPSSAPTPAHPASPSVYQVATNIAVASWQ